MRNNYIFLSIVLSVFAVFIILHSFRYLKTDSQAASIPSTPVSISATQLPKSSLPTPTPLLSSTKFEIIKATYGPPDGFLPTEFTVKQNVPIRLEVTATEDGIGCMGSLMVPDFSSQVEFFEKGKTNIIEFVPTTTGLHYITCGMGIPHAYLIVK